MFYDRHCSYYCMAQELSPGTKRNWSSNMNGPFYDFAEEPFTSDDLIKIEKKMSETNTEMLKHEEKCVA